MGVQWTKEQQEVIRLRDRNILVSAAAGSGKTAVLVERILSKITDKEHPVDIDRLLIMTFTRAAAGEMKERISAAIEKALCEDPDNEHLQRQTTLLHTAQITTIDGFCAYIIRNYFHLIGLDPGYRTADEGELKLLRGDVVKALLEEYYAKKDEKFQKFVECFATGKSDENLGNLIQKLYEMAMSNPFPQEWLSGCMDDYRIDSLEELRETEWMRMLWDAVKDELQEAKLLVQEARRICSEPDGPYLYDEALSSDLLLIRSLQELAEKRDYNGTAEILMKPSFARLSTKKAADVDEQKKQRVKDLRDEEKGILKELGQRYFQSAEKELLEVILHVMEENVETYMPGFTHLQKAQPITLAHHMGAYFEMFRRDHERLQDIAKRMNTCPLGSGALAGTTYPLDREYTAELLGFDGPTLNSMDGVSDRDYLLELLSALSIIMMHLSRFCEEVIIWNSNEYQFVEIDDAYSTGSSIMPQKKNPDIAELVRGKTGRVYGALNALLTTMKGIPLAYNKDMQEDKEWAFDAMDTAKGCITLFAGMLKTMQFNKDRMEESAKHGFTNATDAADYLVNHGVPFRDAHGIVGKLVLTCIEKKIPLDALPLEEYKKISPVFEEDIYEAIDLETCVNKRITIGAPGKDAMAKSIAAYKKYMAE